MSDLDLRTRIARALRWADEEAERFSLQTLRDLVRPVSPKLAALATDEIGAHEDVDEVREHGRVWYVCKTCGAQWDDADEQISDGDGYCEEHAE